MSKHYKLPILLFIVFTLQQNAIPQKPDTLKIIPGAGIVLKNDTLKLGVSFSEFQKVTKITKDSATGIMFYNGKDVHGNPVDFSNFEKNLKFENFLFRFIGDKQDEIKLFSIQIDGSDKDFIFFNPELYIGMKEPPIEKFFQIKSQYDRISDDKLNYYFYSAGIFFEVKKDILARVTICGII